MCVYVLLQLLAKLHISFDLLNGGLKSFLSSASKQLFTTLVVRPILEYGSAIWGPQYAVYSDKIESIQKQFLLFCFRNLWNGWDSNIRLTSYKNV